MREDLPSQLLWVAAWPLVTCVGPVYIVDKVVCVFLLLLKGVRMLHGCM